MSGMRVRLPWVCLAAPILALTPASAQSYGVAPGIGVATASASVTIVSATAVAQAEDLGGNLAAGAVEGDVVVDPSAKAGSKAAQASPLRPAAYRVAGRRNATFALALPDAADCVLTGPQATIPITGFKVSVAGGTATDAPGGLNLDPLGQQAFKVGASMRLAKGLPQSTYVGQFKVTMAYN